MERSDLRYQAYVEIFRVFQEFIIDLNQWIIANINFFEKNK